MVRLFVLNDRVWEASKQEFDSVSNAVDFCHAEVGVPWLLVDEQSVIVAAGDRRGAFIYPDHAPVL